MSRRQGVVLSAATDRPPSAAASEVSSSSGGSNSRVLSFLLQYSYMAVIVAVMALPSGLSSVEATLGSHAKGVSLPSILTTATFAIVIGKFTIPVDEIGGKRTLKAGMFTISALLWGQSMAPSLGAFGAMWIVLCYIYSSSWGAVGKIVREEFEESRWGSELGGVAASSRLGSMLSSVVYGLVLRRPGGDWRAVFRFASVFLLSSLVLFSAVEGVDKSNRRHSATEPPPLAAASSKPALSSKEVIQKCLRSPIFWFMLCGKVLLMNIGQFISFLSLFLHSSLGISQANAATYSGIFAAGSFVSSAAGAALYQRYLPQPLFLPVLSPFRHAVIRLLHRLSRNRQLVAVAACNIASAVICALFAFQTVAPTKFPLPATLLLLFGLGFSWAFAFYVSHICTHRTRGTGAARALRGLTNALLLQVPPGLVCLKLGGKEHAALLTNIYDGVGFLSAAFFTYFATRKYWTSVLVFLSACSAISCVAMGRAMALTNRQEERWEREGA